MGLDDFQHVGSPMKGKPTSLQLLVCRGGWILRTDVASSRDLLILQPKSI